MAGIWDWKLNRFLRILAGVASVVLLTYGSLSTPSFRTKPTAVVASIALGFLLAVLAIRGRFDTLSDE
jgi:hypothetical protein